MEGRRKRREGGEEGGRGGGEEGGGEGRGRGREGGWEGGRNTHISGVVYPILTQSRLYTLHTTVS